MGAEFVVINFEKMTFTLMVKGLIQSSPGQLVICHLVTPVYRNGTAVENVII